MKKQTASVRPPAPAVLTMAEIVKLSQKEQCSRFAERATVSQRAFAEMGKLHHSISSSLKKGQTIYGELRKVGVKDSTISNASYASKVFQLVNDRHLTEEQFDGLTFADCLAIVRVMGDKSARKIGPEEVAAVMLASPDTFDSELESIFTTGLTVAEELAQADLRTKREAVGKIRESIAETRREFDDVMADLDPSEAESVGSVTPIDEACLDEPVWTAHYTALKGLLAKAIKVRADVEAKRELEQQQQPQQEDTAPPTAESTEENGGPENTEPAPPVTPSGEEAPTSEMPAPPAPAAAADTEGDASPVPSNVTSMPATVDSALPEVLQDLDNLLEEVNQMSVEAKKAIFEKLNTMMAELDSQINGPAAMVA